MVSEIALNPVLHACIQNVRQKYLNWLCDRINTVSELFERIDAVAELI
jgi:hypothetical protein